MFNSSMVKVERKKDREHERLLKETEYKTAKIKMESLKLRYNPTVIAFERQQMAHEMEKQLAQERTLNLWIQLEQARKGNPAVQVPPGVMLPPPPPPPPNLPQALPLHMPLQHLGTHPSLPQSPQPPPSHTPQHFGAQFGTNSWGGEGMAGTLPENLSVFGADGGTDGTSQGDHGVFRAGGGFSQHDQRHD